MKNHASLASMASPQTLPRADLPAEWPARAAGHWGGGQPCAVCTDSISPAQAEVRAVFGGDDLRTFHARCFVDWWQGISAAGAAGAA